MCRTLWKTLSWKVKIMKKESISLTIEIFWTHGRAICPWLKHSKRAYKARRYHKTLMECWVLQYYLAQKGSKIWRKFSESVKYCSTKPQPPFNSMFTLRSTDPLRPLLPSKANTKFPCLHGLDLQHLTIKKEKSANATVPARPRTGSAKSRSNMRRNANASGLCILLLSLIGDKKGNFVVDCSFDADATHVVDRTTLPGHSAALHQFPTPIEDSFPPQVLRSKLSWHTDWDG